MSTCARCGLPVAVAWPHADDDDKVCFAKHGYEEHTIQCRDRQIAAQAALLRSVTGKLEKAHEWLGDGLSKGESEAQRLIEQVLEVLS